MGQLRDYISKYSAFVIVLLGTLLNLIPFFSGQSNNTDAEYLYSLNDMEAQSSLFITVGATLPVFYDLTIDCIYYVRSSNSYRLQYILLFVVALPDIIFLSIMIPNKQYDLLLCIMNARDTLFTCLFLLHLNKLSPSIFRWQAIYFVGLCFILSNLILTNSFFTTDEWFIQNYMNLLYCITGIGLIVLGTLFIIWFKYLYSIRNNNNINSSLSKSDYKCNIYVISYIIFVAIEWIPILTIPSTSSENIQWASRIGVHYFTLHTIAILVSMTGIIVWTTRLAKQEMSDISQLLQSRKEFMRYISHEIRTPLNIMKAGLTVLEEDLLRGTQLADLNETILDIKGCCDIAVDTLSDMLTYDKVESCKMELEKSNLNVDKFFTDCLRPFNMQARAKVITLKSAIMCSTRVYRRLHMIGDESKLAQVMRNLLSNALKFTPIGGSITVKISVEKGAESVNKSDANKSYFLKVEVIDSGAGISEENQGKLFKGIVQFNAGRLQGGGGTGLGLYISKGIVDLHGGSLSVFSAGEGSGTTFNLLLPLSIEVSVHSSHSSRSRRSSTEESYINMFRSKSHSNISNSSINISRILPVVQYSEKDKENMQYLERRELSRIPELRNSIMTEYLESSSTRKSMHVLDSNNNEIKEFGNSIQRLSIYKLNENNINDNNNNNNNTNDEKKDNELKSFSRNSEFNKPNMLIVDDSDICRKMMVRLMADRCKSSQTAMDGIDALNKIKETLLKNNNDSNSTDNIYFDVILMDNQMPNMNGPTATSRLREMGYKGLIIGLTGVTSDEENKKFKSSGVDHIFVKPLDIDAFDSYISSHWCPAL